MTGKENAMQWEYFTTFLQAQANFEMEFLEKLRDWKEGIPPHAPEALIPRLNAYGDEGWELVHMQPVAIGNKADVLMQDSYSGSRFRTFNYFCVFKRPKG
jgi:hypothetical protein